MQLKTFQESTQKLEKKKREEFSASKAVKTAQSAKCFTCKLESACGSFFRKLPL